MLEGYISRKTFKTRYKEAVLFFCLILLTLPVTNINVTASENYELIIRITEVVFPPKASFQSNTSAMYDFSINYEIVNLKETNITIVTPNTNLLAPKLEANFESDLEYQAGFFSFPAITNHTIKAGKTEGETGITLSVEGYNNTIPPEGKYVFWLEIDSNQPISYATYKTTIVFDKNSIITNSELTEINSASTPLVLILASLLAITIVFRSKHSKEKML